MAMIPFAINRSILENHEEAIYSNWDSRCCPHILVVGATGSGKTYAVKLLMGKVAKYAPNAKITVCDYKAEDFRFLNGCSRYYAFDHCAEGLDRFFSEFQARQSGDDDSRTMRLLVFDEWAAFLQNLDKKDAAEAQKKLATLLMLGRSFNIHVIVSTQRADAEYFSKARDNFSMVIAMGNLSKESAAMFGFDREAMLNCYEAGQGHILRNGVDLEPIIVQRVRNMKLLEETIRRAVE